MSYSAGQFDYVMEPDQSKPVDLVHLSRQTFGNKDLEQEVLRLFLGHSEECLERLRQARDNKMWADAAHSLKGTARTIGAWQLGEICEKSECSARAEEGMERKLELDKIIQQTTEVIHYIENLIAEA